MSGLEKIALVVYFWICFLGAGVIFLQLWDWMVLEDEERDLEDAEDADSLDQGEDE